MSKAKSYILYHFIYGLLVEAKFPFSSFYFWLGAIPARCVSYMLAMPAC
jgi:hypothetical protein